GGLPGGEGLPQVPASRRWRGDAVGRLLRRRSCRRIRVSVAHARRVTIPNLLPYGGTDLPPRLEDDLGELVHLVGVVHRGVQEQLVDADVLERLHPVPDLLRRARGPLRELRAHAPEARVIVRDGGGRRLRLADREVGV